MVENPAYWAGAAAVSAPIIIHLINRLRYKKIRWAAMEFLLKSQQRNRRKLIIEQLILLALRCLLVMLVVMMVVRPMWGLGQDKVRDIDLPTYHVFLLDDSFSMQDLEDAQVPEGETAFRRAAKLIEDQADKYSKLQGTHYFTVLKLSNLQTPEIGKPFSQLLGAAPGQQLTDDEVKKLRNKIGAIECSYLPLSLLKGIKEANGYFETVQEGNKHLHIVSDFREPDWTVDEAAEVYKLLAEIGKKDGKVVKLHDVATPRRSTNPQEAPRGNPNLGILSLVAKARPKGDTAKEGVQDDLPLRVVTPNIPIYLHATVQNFGAEEKTQVRFSLKIDGVERNEFSRVVERISSGKKEDVIFDLRFTDEDLPKPKDGERDTDRRIFKQISIRADDKDHLVADNVRYTYLELRKEIPVLLVDPFHSTRDFRPDSLYLDNALTGSDRSGLSVRKIGPKQLKNEKELERHPVIYLLNVPGVGSGLSELDPEDLKVLESYVFRGGSVVFFLGDRINVENYRKELYRNGEGIFPAPLVRDSDRQMFVHDDPDPLAEEEPKQRILKDKHPVFDFGKLTDSFIKYMYCARYYRVDPNWKPDENTSVVVQLANRKLLRSSIFSDLAKPIRAALNDPNNPERFRPKLTFYAGKIRDWMDNADEKRARKGPLIEAVEGLLNDPALADFWVDPTRQKLKDDLNKFRDELKKGDPLVIEAAVGKGKVKGHVMAFMTSCAPTPVGGGKELTWNNWANELFYTFVPMCLQLQSYMGALSRAADDVEINRDITLEPMVLRLDQNRYGDKLHVWFQKEGQDEATKADEVNGALENDEMVFRITPTKGPGHYKMRLNPTAAEGGVDSGKDPEWRPLAFNVDDRIEGNLKRVSEEEVQKQMVKALHTNAELKISPEDAQTYVQSKPLFDIPERTAGVAEDLRNRSWSEYSFVLPLFLGLLLLEQFLAMLFSHHLKGGEAQMPPQAMRAFRPKPEPLEAEVVEA